jgi:hypothetical protein
VQGSGGRRAEVRPVAKRTGQAFSSTAPVPLFLEGWRDNSRLVGHSEVIPPWEGVGNRFGGVAQRTHFETRPSALRALGPESYSIRSRMAPHPK